MDFAVTLVQMPCKEGRREDNFSYAREMLQGHRTKGDTEFIIFPELFAIGFRYSDYVAEGPGVPGPTTEFVQEVSEEYSAYALATDIEQAGTKWYNTLIMSSPNGRVIASYRKIHPFQDEREAFEGGDSAVMVKIGGINIGLEICYDIRFPELSRLLALNGAEIILMPAAFPDPRAPHWGTLLKARAIENQLYVAACNRVGMGYNGKTYFGHSQIVDPWGECLTRINTDQSIFTASGNTAMIEDVRKQIACYKDRVPERYGNVRVLEE
jgi:omega-amidase